MREIVILRNKIQEYSWGSYDSIPELLNQKAYSKKPQAELWMGAHPKAPSEVKIGDKWNSLLDLIKKYPNEILGKSVANNYNNQLPFLFKVLAAAQPLSIQAHPNKEHAKKGFKRENEIGIPLDSYKRNYQDENHKPECLCALTEFWALKGFRSIADILKLIKITCQKSLGLEIQELKNHSNSKGLQSLFQTLMSMDSERKEIVINEAITCARKLETEDEIFKWIIKIHSKFPEDIGVLAPIIFNLVRLKPGEAIFLPAKEPHSYLEGTGIEIMANSDNVLRAGLTSKNMDLKELIKVLKFEPNKPKILLPVMINEHEGIYETDAKEFCLSVIKIKNNRTYNSPLNKNVEILLCTDGKIQIIQDNLKKSINISKGTSVLIPASVKSYVIQGNATLYKAATAL